MTGTAIKNWQSVQQEVLNRINSKLWKPGDLIPNEAQLASEFGCARATVNRALQNLADTGLLERRRKAGTRVATHPVRKATLDIPIIRKEITGKGYAYRYALVSTETVVPPRDMAARMRLKPDEKILHIVGLHMANGEPYVFENRWINSNVVPAVRDVDFSKQSPNEWLVENIPFTSGDIAFSALCAGAFEAEMLSCKTGEGLFVIDRSTWKAEGAITSVRLVFAPGYRIHTEI
ncbi:GntR family transcriptional regulator [Ahrensia kielensis]|uniref:GntR family transcriptional regulator n=1 Tax=Ahrensia kielensis TaxID=76980 RepID=A0ABU9TAL5_9HYPH